MWYTKSDGNDEMMSDDAKKNIPGALMGRPDSEDRKPSAAAAAAAAATPTPPKKVIIKSADMLPDMQKEAVDIAVGVSSSSFPLFNLELFA